MSHPFTSQISIVGPFILHIIIQICCGPDRVIHRPDRMFSYNKLRMGRMRSIYLWSAARSHSRAVASPFLFRAARDHDPQATAGARRCCSPSETRGLLSCFLPLGNPGSFSYPLSFLFRSLRSLVLSV